MAKSVINDLLQIFRASVSAVLPEKLIRNTVKYNPKSDILTIADVTLNVKDKNVYVIGTGKAVQNMAREVENLLGSKIKQGIISIPIGSLNSSSRSEILHYYEGAKNNLPDLAAEDTAKKIKSLVSKLGKDDILLVLISGGGSALLPLPKEPIKLEEKTQLIKKLANSGADITELNTVRKKLSNLKGGRLAIIAQPANVFGLILSDIVGDPVDLIASGPTIENIDSSNAALDIVNKYNLYNKLPDSIKNVLTSNCSKSKFENRVNNFIIGSNKISIKAAIDKSKGLNYQPVYLSNMVVGDVKDIAKKYVKLTKLLCNFIEGSTDMKKIISELSTLNIPGLTEDSISALNLTRNNMCLILGGEITVEVTGSGKGGRNQQLALEYSNYIYTVKQDFENFDIYILSAGTDGIDGPTDAAGAIGYINLISDSKAENIDIHKFLENNDSYNFYKTFQRGQLHVITGHTNTNVMDIHLILILKKSALN